MNQPDMIRSHIAECRNRIESIRGLKKLNPEREEEYDADIETLQREIRALKYQLKKLEESQKLIKRCIICGKEFTARRDSQKCCSSECRKENASRYQKAKYYKTSRTAKSPEPKRPKNNITEIAVAARAEGLTYGQYVARYEMNPLRK